MLKLIAFLSLASLLGCHGSEIIVGGGHLWGEDSVSASAGCGGRARSSSTNDWFAGGALVVQTTPRSVVNLDPAPSPTSSKRLYPYEPEPDPLDAAFADLTDKLATVASQLERLSLEVSSLRVRLSKIETDLDQLNTTSNSTTTEVATIRSEAMTKDEILKILGGGSTLGILSLGGVSYYRRRRQAPQEES